MSATPFPPRPAPPTRRASDDWRKAAPRWLVVAALILSTGYIFWLHSRLLGQYEAQANADAPSRYQARLSERVAVVESQAIALQRSMSELGGKLDAQSKATTDLTVQLTVLSAQMRAEARARR